MTAEELLDKLNEIQLMRCETKELEIKSARTDCPKRLFDTLSSFSNQENGGIIIFGVDEKHNYEECGVYDPQDIQKKINEQCLQMEPIVRPLLTVVEKNGLFFVAAEIPGLDIADRPCFYSGKGRMKGSYIRIGDSDEPMTDYEIYSYEAFRKKCQDDVRPVPRATFGVLDSLLLEEYMIQLKKEKPNLSAINEECINELIGITRDGQITVSSLFLFCRYPQVFFPQLCITAVVVPGEEMGSFGDSGERFLANKRIEGNITSMLEQTIMFIQQNMRTKTIINPNTGKREDKTEYPITAIREVVLNALVHRDYSVHTENSPIRVVMYSNRIEVTNPGGIYGRISVDQLGKLQPETRNPVLATALEVMNITENRYSGIPTIRRTMDDHGLDAPVFADERGTFKVTLYNDTNRVWMKDKKGLAAREETLLAFLEVPRSRNEIATFLGINTVAYAMKTHIQPLVDAGLVRMTIPDNPRSHAQKYVRARG